MPRDSGHEIVVGATVEEKGFDGAVTAGGVYELLRDARQVLPMTAEYRLAETSVGWRPGTPDNAPILGPVSWTGLVLATGHFRNGVLLTPVTADIIATSDHDRVSVPELAAAVRSPALRAAPRSGPRRDGAVKVFVNGERREIQHSARLERRGR